METKIDINEVHCKGNSPHLTDSYFAVQNLGYCTPNNRHLHDSNTSSVTQGCSLVEISQFPIYSKRAK